MDPIQHYNAIPQPRAIADPYSPAGFDWLLPDRLLRFGTVIVRIKRAGWRNLYFMPDPYLAGVSRQLATGLNMCPLTYDDRAPRTGLNENAVMQVDVVAQRYLASALVLKYENLIIYVAIHSEDEVGMADACLWGDEAPLVPAGKRHACIERW